MRPPRGHSDYAIELTAAQTLELAVETMQRHLPLSFASPRYTPSDIWHVVLLAAAQGRSIDAAAADLSVAPAATTVRYQLQQQIFARHNLLALEQMLNAALVAQLPPGIRGGRHRLAIDLTLIPYHGQPLQDPDEVRRGEAKSGTTHFHAYALVYVIRHHQRVTLTLTYVLAGETLATVLTRLLMVQPFTTILPVPKRGKRLRALLQGRKSYRTSYEVRSPKHGAEEIVLYVVTRYAKGRHGKHRLEHLPYAVVGEFDRPVVLLRKDRHEHRGRFGIESSYRLGNALRPRTTSRSPKVRLLLMGLAAILVNLWVWLKWTAAGVPQRGPGGRAVRQDLLRLTRLRTFLTLAIQAIHGVVLAIRRPSSGSSGPSSRTRLIDHRRLAFAEY